MTDSEKLKIRNDVGRLANCDTIADLQDMLTAQCECLLAISQEHSQKSTADQSVSEAKLVAQMIFSKLLNLKRLLEGVDFKSRTGSNLPNTIDPTVVGVLIRNIFETVAMFNLIYMSGNNAEQKKILYNLWVIAGLKYRQKLAVKITTKDANEKQKDELDTINKLTEEIHQSSEYKNLESKGQEMIDHMIKKKDYKLTFSGTDIKFHSWEDLIKVMNVKPEIAEEMYTYLSLYGHPSNVSVFQFRDLFKTPDASKGMAIFNAKYAIMLTSVFIGDYLRLFPEMQSVFDELPLEEQAAINLFYGLMKVDGSPINEAFDKLA